MARKPRLRIVEPHQDLNRVFDDVRDWDVIVITPGHYVISRPLVIRADHVIVLGSDPRAGETVIAPRDHTVKTIFHHKGKYGIDRWITTVGTPARHQEVTV